MPNAVLTTPSMFISLFANAQIDPGSATVAEPSVWQQLGAQWEFLWHAAQATPWAFWKDYAWRDYWMQFILADRFRVVFFLPLACVLMLLRGKTLRVGIIATSLVFLTYLFGPLHMIFWSLMLLGLYPFTQRWQFESQRTDVWRGGPILAAILIVMLIAGLSGFLQSVRLDEVFNAKLHEHFCWLWPLAYRGVWWEPRPGAEPGQLFQFIWFDPHSIGTAYLIARLLHYFSELRKNTIPPSERTLLRFLAYFTYAPSLMQGPIERFERFNNEIDTCHQRRNPKMVGYALYRFAIGLSKTLLTTWYFHPLKAWVWNGGGIGDGVFFQQPHLVESYWLLYCGPLIIIFWLYLEFSGYCDFAIGMGYLIGYRHCENFMMPWIATSYRDFWRRWHISLSFLLRDYVYIQLGGNRRHVWWNLMVTFGLCGIWHAVIPILWIWGMLMGTMVYINHVWAKHVAKVDEAKTGWLYKTRQFAFKFQPLPTLFAWFITINSFFLSLLIFFGSDDGFKVMWELVRRPLNSVTGLELPVLKW